MPLRRRQRPRRPPVSTILIGTAVGAHELRRDHPVSAIGAGETVKRLLPQHVREQSWAAIAVKTFRREIYLGLTSTGTAPPAHWEAGTPTKAGRSQRSDSVHVRASLKDTHDAGPANHHTQFMVLAGSTRRVLAPRSASQNGPTRCADVPTTGEVPRACPLIVYHELGTCHREIHRP